MTLPDPLDIHRPSPSNKRPRLSSSNSAPAAEMDAMVGTTQSPPGPKVAAKAASFTGVAGHFPHGGDTQPVDSQVYHRYTELESMRDEATSTTPWKQQSVAGTSPETMATDGDNSPQQTLQPGQVGYVDLDGMWQDKPASPATSFANYDELLVGDNAKSPDTQFYQPHRPTMPETPALAGQKHGRDGEPLTSVTTATKYSQIFPHAPVMGPSQLFAQTQDHSSPFGNGLPSDDAMTRPSPITNGAEANDMSSPRTILSSPVLTRHVRSSSGAGEPRTEYRRMKESQEQREQRLRAELEKEGANDLVESDSDDDTQQRRFRAKQLRRSKSEQALKEAARVSAPPRGVHLSSSTRKSVVDLVTPATTRRKVSFDDILEEGEEEGIRAELPEGQSSGNEDDEHAAESHDEEDHDGNDQYDELQEKVIRSQSNIQQGEEEDSASFVGSVQENGVEDSNNNEPLDDTQDPDDTDTVVEDDDLQDPHEDGHNTQRSTIADSQPVAHAHAAEHTTTRHAQHSSMASFIPGSQYTGKTSQDQAFLRTSHPIQVRVAASQVNEPDKVPSSPPLPKAVVDTPEHSSSPPSVRQEAYKLSQTRQESTREDSATPQEVPDSDCAEKHTDKPQLEASTNGVGEEESNNNVPFSTAQTHVSASTRSPTKSFVAPSPLKAFRSQQNETPRKAFRDMIDGPKATNASFDFVDVDDIMAGVMTKEDEEVLAVLSSPTSKRRKINRSNLASSRLLDGHDKSDQSLHAHTYIQQHGMSESSRTLQDSEPDFARPALPKKAQVDKRLTLETVHESVVTSETEGTIPESEPDSVPVESRAKTVLAESPSKANVLPNAPQQEPQKARSSTPDSAEQREDAGSRHVSQLISTTRSSVPVSKKGKLKTPGRVTRRRSGRSEHPAKRTSRAKSHHFDTSDEERDEDIDPEEVSKEAELVDEINRNDATPPPADRVHQTTAEPTLPTLGELAAEDVSVQHDTSGALSAPERVWALFRGTPPNFYPATWLGGSLDGMTYKIRFDDKTVTNLDSWHVRSLEFRIGDQVKVDNGVGSRSKPWRVVGFGAVTSDVNGRELGTDTRGHTHIKVQAATNRNSVPKDGPAADEDAGKVREVLISDLYLTSGMWKHYKAREFNPPIAVKPTSSRAGTPSSRLQTPDGDTPASRSRRNGPPTGKTKSKMGTSHLRDTSVASSTSFGSAAIFFGMAFAVTYISNDGEKAQVTRMIQRNGGIILDEGFGDLFDHPSIDEQITSPSKSPHKTTENGSNQPGLHLKSKYLDYGFVALIADRHSRRAKYMQALALDLPTLSGRWILDSLDEVKNPTLNSREMAPLPWGKYLLPAGESSYLGGAIRSRVMLPYDATSSQLRVTVQTRPLLLNDEGVLIVAPKKDKVAWERRKTYAFLTLALGAGMVERVNYLQDAKSMMEADPHIWKWIYVDGKIDEAFPKLCGKIAGGKKRKRVSEAVLDSGAKMSVTDGVVTVVNDEFVVQSLILGALAD